jgi:acetylornithine deacetylase
MPTPATAPFTDDERRVLEEVDDAHIERDLRELVAIPSVDGTPAEGAVQRWCADRLAGLGMRVDQWEIDLDALRAEPGFPGMEVERSGLSGCVGAIGPDRGPALVLCGHTDVVPPGDLSAWAGRDPFSLDIDGDGRAWGRGACDMKGGVAAVIGAAAALSQSGLTLRRPLAVHCVSAEEDGGAGAYATLQRGHRPDACVIAEPTNGQLIPANAGSLTFRLEIEGRATHGATRTRGVSAIEKFEVVHTALRALEAQRNAEMPAPFDHLDLAWPLSVGIVSAGDWASTVPDRLVAAGRYGVRVGETVGDARRHFEAAVAAACDADSWLRDHPASVTWPGGVFAPGALPSGHRLLEDVRRAVRDVSGVEPGAFGGPYGSDLRHYADVGVATLQYGPGDVEFAHAADEHVRLDDVYACARVYALLAVRSCSAATASAGD